MLNVTDVVMGTAIRPSPPSPTKKWNPAILNRNTHQKELIKWLVALLKAPIKRCFFQHGVSSFSESEVSRPSNLNVNPLQRWKEDPEFVEQVKDVWKDNPLWYGICYENNDDGLEGFWGELRDPYDANRKTLYFLGHTKSQVIPRMKTCLSFL